MPITKSEPAAEPSPARVSKLDRLIKLLGEATGAAMPAMMAATDWQAHSIRGAMAGALRRKGHQIASEKVEGVRRWKIIYEAPQ